MINTDNPKTLLKWLQKNSSNIPLEYRAFFANMRAASYHSAAECEQIARVYKKTLRATRSKLAGNRYRLKAKEDKEVEESITHNGFCACWSSRRECYILPGCIEASRAEAMEYLGLK